MKTIHKVLSLCALLGALLLACGCSGKSALSVSLDISGDEAVRTAVKATLSCQETPVLSSGETAIVTVTLANSATLAMSYRFTSADGVMYDAASGVIEGNGSVVVTVTLTKGKGKSVTLALALAYDNPEDILKVKTVTVPVGIAQDLASFATVLSGVTLEAEVYEPDASVVTNADGKVVFTSAKIYTIAYTATTASGTKVVKSGTLKAKALPTIADADITVAAGVPFTLASRIKATDGKGKDLSALLAVKEATEAVMDKDHLTYATQGVKSLTVTVTDPDLPLYPVEMTISVTVREAKTPVLTQKAFTITAGDEVDLLSLVTATDDIDGDITAKTRYTLAKDGEEMFLWNATKLFREAGKYSITYDITNSSGLSSALSFDFTVADMALADGSLIRNSTFTKDAYWTTNVENVLTIAPDGTTMSIGSGSDITSLTLTSAPFALLADTTYQLELDLRFAANHEMRYEIQDASTHAVLFRYDFKQDPNDTCDLLPYGTMAEDVAYGGFHAKDATNAVIVISLGAGAVTTLALNKVDVKALTTTDKAFAIGDKLDVITAADDYEFQIYRGFYKCMSYSRMWGYNSSISGELDRVNGPYNAGEIEYCTLTFNVKNEYVILLTDLSFLPNGLAFYVNVK